MHTELIEYLDGETQLEAYVTWDDTISGPRPGVLVAHDWTGRVPPLRVMQSMEKAESPMADADRIDMMDMNAWMKGGQCSGNVAAAEAMTK